MAEPQLCNTEVMPMRAPDRKSTRLNSSHTVISYAVFCLKKKNLAAGSLARKRVEPGSAVRIMTGALIPDGADTVAHVFFFFNDTATTEIYTLSLHDALPILRRAEPQHLLFRAQPRHHTNTHRQDRKSTRLNSSHTVISYAVFCLKKKKK